MDVTKDWLEQLTVGEEVGIRESTEGISSTVNYTKAAIMAITDNEIEVEKNLVFNKNGLIQQENNMGTKFTYQIIPLTNEVKKKAKFYQLSKFIGMMTTNGIL